MAGDHIDAHKKQPRFDQGGFERCADLLFARGEFGGFRMPPHRQIAAEFTGFGFAVHRPQGVAVHQQDALVAVAHLGQEGLNHHRQLLLLGDQFQQGTQARAAAAGAHHPLAGPAPQGLEHHLAVAGGKAVELLHVGRHQGGGHQLREAQGAEFFVPGPQAGGAVEHLHALALGQLQQVGGIEVGLIHRRVLAHPHPLEALQRLPAGFLQGVPGLGVDRCGPHLGAIGCGGQIALLRHPDRFTGPLAGLHQRHAAVLFRAQARHRINDEKLATHGALRPQASRPSSWPLRSRP